jgi:hypothetical protein
MASMLLHLKPENALVLEQVAALLGPAEGRPSTMDTRLGDFDNAYWRIEVVESAPTQVFVCLEVPCYAQLKACVREGAAQGQSALAPAHSRTLKTLYTTLTLDL